MKGPIKFNEKQYADYDVGVYDDASFHAVEQDDTKQVMGRVTINPLGAKSPVRRPWSHRLLSITATQTSARQTTIAL